MNSFLRELRDRLLGGQTPPPQPSPEAREELAHCIVDVVQPALRGARERLEAEGYQVEFEEAGERCVLRVANNDGSKVFFAVEGRLYHRPAFAFPVLHGRQDRPRFARLHIETNGGAHEHRCQSCSVEGLRDECLETCRKWLAW